MRFLSVLFLLSAVALSAAVRIHHEEPEEINVEMLKIPGVFLFEDPFRPLKNYHDANSNVRQPSSAYLSEEEEENAETTETPDEAPAHGPLGPSLMAARIRGRKPRPRKAGSGGISRGLGGKLTPDYAGPPAKPPSIGAPRRRRPPTDWGKISQMITAGGDLTQTALQMGISVADLIRISKDPAAAAQYDAYGYGGYKK